MENYEALRARFAGAAAAFFAGAFTVFAGAFFATAFLAGAAAFFAVVFSAGFFATEAVVFLAAIGMFSIGGLDRQLIRLIRNEAGQ